MQANTKPELPAQVSQLLRDIDGALGDQFVGAILFGSWANARQEPDQSDIDLAVIVADVAVEHNRQVVFQVLGASSVERSKLSLSVESYLRLKDFLGRGDPFAWVVCTEGCILKERSALLSDLQTYCRSSQEGPDLATASSYLRDKSRTHYTLAIQAFQQFLANIQLSAMAGAQAVAVRQSTGGLTGGLLVRMARWEYLKETLGQVGATAQEIDDIEQLVNAHKLARTETEHFAGREAIELVRRAGKLWSRLDYGGPSEAR